MWSLHSQSPAAMRAGAGNTTAPHNCPITAAPSQLFMISESWGLQLANAVLCPVRVRQLSPDPRWDPL